MWPPVASGVTRLGVRVRGPPLRRCVRLVPQDGDMGGFFAALIRKVKPLRGPSPTSEGVSTAMKAPGASAIVPSAMAIGGLVGGVPRPPLEHRYVPAPEEVLDALTREWGGGGGGDAMREMCACLFTRSTSCRRVTYLSPGIKKMCVDAIGAERLKCVWSGVRVWEKRDDVRGGGGGGGAFPYRLTKEGAVVLARHAGDARRLLMPARDVKQLLRDLGADVPLKAFTPAVANAARAMTPGSVLCELKKVGGGSDDACPPLAVELTPEGTLRVEWRYRKGLEGAPKAAAAAILRKLDANSRDGGY